MPVKAVCRRTCDFQFLLRGSFMKKCKSVFFTIISAAAFLVLSCGNKDVKNIMSIREKSGEKLLKACTRFQDNFMLYSDILDNGYVSKEFFLKDYKIDGAPAEFLRESYLPIELLIKNNIGLKTEFVNDKNAKELRYSYKLKNILKTEKETELINIKIGKKTIEAAIPKLIDTTFFIPSNSVGKSMAFIFPQNFFSYMDADFSYDTLREWNSMKPDKHSKKRYDKARDSFYKNATIKPDGNTYFIEFNNADIEKYISEIVYALKNDNRFKTLWNIYGKMDSNIFENAEEVFNSKIKNTIQKFNLTEKLTVKNNLTARDQFTAVFDGNEIFKFIYEIKDYENPFNGISYTIELVNPDTSEKIHILIEGKGSVTDTKADINIFASIYSLKPSGEPSSGAIDIDLFFYADASTSENNFEAGIDAQYPKHFNDDSDIVKSGFQVVGSMKKTEDSVNYHINNIIIKTNAPAGDNKQIICDTDVQLVFSKTVPPGFEMPNARLNVPEIKPDEWEKIRTDVVNKITELSAESNFK